MSRKKGQSKHRLPIVEVNVVSLMDILTTLLFFVILIASTTRFSAIDAEAIPDSTSTAPPTPTFTLQIAVTSSKKGFVWLGPIDKLKKVDSEKLVEYLGKNYQGDVTAGFLREFKAKNIHRLMGSIQKDLIQIKKSFPHQHRAAISFTNNVRYRDMIHSITKIRYLSDEQKAFSARNLAGQTEKLKVLFPLIVISEWQEPEEEKSEGKS